MTAHVDLLATVPISHDSCRRVRLPFAFHGRNDGLVKSWAAFDGWTIPKTQFPSWTAVDSLRSVAARYVATASDEFPRLLKVWNERFHELDGDPSLTDWHHFRPLRVDREEDWSDWLHHLLRTSTSNELTTSLLRRDRRSDRAANQTIAVTREESVDGRRADIVVEFANGNWAQIEVKVGDHHFRKTIDTASRLEKKHGGRWEHFVLLPREDIAAFEKGISGSRRMIHKFTWDDVAVALRRLATSCESRQWKAFAHAFGGVIEQKLVGCQSAPTTPHTFQELIARQRQISIMKEGLRDE